MGLDTIIVIALAVLFFGGIGFLSWSEQKKRTSQGSAGESTAPSLHPKYEEADRRKRQAG